MTKDKIISTLLRVAPPVIGECPKCGEPLLAGWCCFGCGYGGEKVKLIDWQNLK